MVAVPQTIANRHRGCHVIGQSRARSTWHCSFLSGNRQRIQNAFTPRCAWPINPPKKTIFTSSCARSYLRCTFVVDFRNMRRSARPCERRSDGKGKTERKDPIAATTRTLSIKVCVRHRLPDASSTQNVPRCSFDFHRTNTCTREICCSI